MKFWWLEFKDSEAFLWMKAITVLLMTIFVASAALILVRRLFPDQYHAKGPGPWWMWFISGAWLGPPLIKIGRSLSARTWRWLDRRRRKP